MFKNCAGKCCEAMIKQSLIENEEIITEKPENCEIKDEDINFDMNGINDDFEKLIENEFSDLFEIEEAIFDDIGMGMGMGTDTWTDDASGTGLLFSSSNRSKIGKPETKTKKKSKKVEKETETKSNKTEKENENENNTNEGETSKVENDILMLESLEDLKDESEPKIIYAPKQNTLRGKPKLCVIGIRWTSNNPKKEQRYRMRCENLAGVRRMGRTIENFYDKNSRNQLKFDVSSFVERVPYNANERNLRKAEKLVMSRHIGFHYYAIMSSLNVLSKKKPSNAGMMDGKLVAHLRGNNMRTGCHEMGHLLGLEHSGAYIRGKLDPYGDGFSVMSGIPSGLLNPSQYYKLGWLPEKEVAIFVPGTVYELKRVSQMNKENGLTAVLVENEKGRNAWISRPANCPGNGKGTCLVLHLATSGGAGTQRVKVFGKKYYDERFTNLKIEKIGNTEDGNLKVVIERVET